ncbi:hypothetical protein [Pelistega indica]|nr:hypothetical protein [Pelistega indica]
MGLYRFPDSSSDGMGGSTLAILENQQFVQIAFATLVVGKWEMEQTNGYKLILKPMNPTSRFQVYARKNPDIVHDVRFLFSSGPYDEVYFGFQADKLQRVVKETEETPPPYKFQHALTSKEFFLLAKGEPNDEIVAFNLGLYNDIYIDYVGSSQFVPTTEYLLVQNGLSSPENPQQIIYKEALPQEGEDAEFLKEAEMYYQQAFNADYKLLNTDDMEVEDIQRRIDLGDYHINQRNNHYEANNKTDEPNAYLKIDVLKKYDKLPPEKSLIKTYRVEKGSVL